jgi:uncharacterized membrane protein
MGLATLLVGLAAFIAPHVLVSRREIRARLIERIGMGPYKGLFTVVSLAGIVLIAYGFAAYRAAGAIELWHPPRVMRHVADALMWPASVCVVAAYIPGLIKTTLKHPMLVGVKLWAFAHLLANGDTAGIVLFGSFLAWAVYDRISLKSRSDPGSPGIPVGGWKNDVAAVIVGTLVYLALGFVFHPVVIGVPVFGG